MISFKNWLTRAPSVSTIKERCQPFLRMTDAPLYRGYRFPIGHMMKIEVQAVNKNRQPRDSKLFSHKLVDDWFYENHNIRPRSQAIFCTGAYRTASMYGEVCYLFPVGQFKFVWGVDAETRAPIKDTLLLTRWIENAMHTRTADRTKETVETVMSYVDWNFDHLEDAQESGAEISILCDEVILVPTKKFPDYSKLVREL